MGCRSSRERILSLPYIQTYEEGLTGGRFLYAFDKCEDHYAFEMLKMRSRSIRETNTNSSQQLDMREGFTSGRFLYIYFPCVWWSLCFPNAEVRKKVSKRKEKRVLVRPYILLCGKDLVTGGRILCIDFPCVWWSLGFSNAGDKKKINTRKKKERRKMEEE